MPVLTRRAAQRLLHAGAGEAADGEEALAPVHMSLIDLPAPWLSLLLEELKWSLKPLRGTCRALRDLVQSSRLLPSSLIFNCPISPEQAAAARDRLQLAGMRSKDIELTFAPPGRQRAHLNSATLQLLVPPFPTDTIVEVWLQNLDLDGLVPAGLVTCPNLTRHSLSYCQITGPLHATPNLIIPEWGQVKQLQLTGISAGPGAVSWQQQLRALTGITSFTITVPRWHHDMPVDDECMEALLSLPLLERVICPSFQLQHSYHDRPCRWSHVIGLALDVGMLGRLPLQGVRSMHVRSNNGNRCDLGGVVTPSNDLQATHRVAAAVARCDDFSCDSDREVGITVYYKDGGADSACLAASMSILAACKPANLLIVGGSITAEDCTMAPDAWPLLLPSLPPTTVQVTLYIEDEALNEARATQACVSAVRPLELDLSTWSGKVSWREGAKQRIQAAMAAAGHQHVTLDLQGLS